MMLIKTCVKPSAIHGLGLFALEFIPCGTPIWRFQTGFDHDFSPAQFAALAPLAREHTRWFCFVRKRDGHIILSGDHACFLNHSPTPNTGAPPGTPTPVETVALRDIAAGEEITCNYFDYDADTPWKLGFVATDAPLGAGVLSGTPLRMRKPSSPLDPPGTASGQSAARPISSWKARTS
jgi:hypothetical protein